MLIRHDVMLIRPRARARARMRARAHDVDRHTAPSMRLSWTVPDLGLAAGGACCIERLERSLCAHNQPACQSVVGWAQPRGLRFQDACGKV